MDNAKAFSIIRPSLKTLKNMVEVVAACKNMRILAEDIRAQLSVCVHELADCLTHTDELPATIGGQDSAEFLKKLQSNYREYYLKFYNTCVRVTAEQVFLVMGTDLTNPSLSIPLERLWVPKNMPHSDAVKAVLHTVYSLVRAGCTNVIVASGDGEYSDNHRQDTQGKAMNVLQLVKQCREQASITDAIQDSAKRLELADKIIGAFYNILGSDQIVILARDDLLDEIKGGDIDQEMADDAVASDPNLQGLHGLIKECTDEDMKRVLQSVFHVLVGKHKSLLLRQAKLNLNTASAAVIQKHFYGITKTQAQALVHARTTRETPFATISDLEPSLQEALRTVRNGNRYKFDGELVTPAITKGKRTLTQLRDIYSRMLFVLEIKKRKESAARPEIPTGSGPYKAFVGGMDWSCKQDSRVRQHFSCPVFTENKISPLWFLGCWVHLFKRFRMAICSGGRAGAPADQVKLHQAYAAVIQKDSQCVMTMDMLGGEDSMSVPVAVLTFSLEMVQKLEEGGFSHAAEFANNVRLFYVSCNTRGMTMEQRRQMWKSVYDWLMNMADLFAVGEYVNGIPRITWEGTLVFLSSLLQICDYLEAEHPKTYEEFNIRSINNDPVENFFGCLGYHTKAQNILRYHNVKIEAAKRLRRKRKYRYPWSSRKNTIADTLPFNKPGITSRKRRRVGELADHARRCRMYRETDGPASHAKSLRDRASCKSSNINKVDKICPENLIIID